MTEFDHVYWRRMAEQLDTTDDVRHTEFAKFVYDQVGDKVRFVAGPGWHRWNGKHWESDASNASALQAITDAALILSGYASESGQGWALKSASSMLVHHIRRGIVAEMEALREFRSSADELDDRPHLLNFQNGTVDLRDGTLKPHDPADLLTHIAPVEYNPDAKSPRWERFVAEILPGRDDVQEYLQRFLGLCVTGESKDHLLGVWHGEHGRNGKSTIIRTMEAVFGTDIVHEVDFSMYEGGRGREPHSEDYAAMRAARMVVASEGEAGAPMNASRIKKHTGGDRIQARHLYGRPFSFRPKFTLVLSTNHLPELSAGGAAIWARTKAIEFTEHFVGDKVDHSLEPTIQGPEAEGVAAWVVQGAMRYYADGRLTDVAAVLEATETHRQEVDPLRDLVVDVFVYEDDAMTKSADFNADLKRWRETNGDNTTKFAPSVVKRHLASRGVVCEKRSGPKGYATYFVGIRLVSDMQSGPTVDESGRIRVLPGQGA